MTAPVVSPADAGQAQRRLAELAAYQIPQLELSDFEQWAPEVAGLIRRGGRASAAVSAREYLQMRTAARVAGRFTPVLAPPVPAEQIGKSLRWAAFAPGEAETQTRVQGIVQKLVLKPGRDTFADSTSADPAAVGYVRVPSPSACAFCVLLGTRMFDKRGNVQGVYKSQDVALFKNGVEGDKYHDFCRCGSAAIFSGQSYDPPEHVRRADELYTDATGHVDGKAKLSAFRKAWTNR